jgi:predicted enzyme involved in methoxymalonyl-ACP biosynthesis
VTLLMMSCRAMGRGVIEALLAWLARSAARGGAQALAVPCLVTPRNVPLRLALAAAGFRAPETPEGPSAGNLARYSRGLSLTTLPALPGWATAPGEP